MYRQVSISSDEKSGCFLIQLNQLTAYLYGYLTTQDYTRPLGYENSSIF